MNNLANLVVLRGLQVTEGLLRGRNIDELRGMTRFRLPDWFILAGLLALAATVLGWLLIGTSGDGSGMQALPGPNGSSVAFLTDGGAGEIHGRHGVNELTHTAVAALPDEAWQRWGGRGTPPLPRGEAVWVRVILQNPGAAVAQGVLKDALPYSDRVDLFTPEEESGGGWVHLRSGEWTPAHKKALFGRETAFPLMVPAHGERTVYLRYEDYFMVWLQLEWWPAQGEFHAARLRTTLAEGFYFGVLLALLFYNAVLWARLRFSDTGYYLLYLGSFTVYLFLARSELLVLGGALGSPWMETASMVVLALSGAFLAQFVRVFLELPMRTSRADRVARTMRIVMAMLALGALAAPWIGYANWLSYIVLGSAVAHLVLMGAAVAAWRAGARQARYFVLAFGLLFSGLFPALASWLYTVSLSDVAITAMLGSALEMLLLSVATADRFAQIQREKLAAQQSLLVEAEQRQIMQEAYADELALEVRERTRELEAANADKDRMIAVLGHDLRSPLTGLTQTAEHLMAVPAPMPLERFACEAARTGRELLLMIEDLVLWARLRAGAGHVTVHTVCALIAPAVALHRTQAERSGIALITQVSESLLVEADLVLVQTLIRNLLTNALKFTRQRVLISALVVPDGVRLAVRDDGPGLPAAVSAQLATKHLGPLPIEGGLGLRLCREISCAMGTRLETTSPPDGGTEFYFILPLVKASQPS